MGVTQKIVTVVSGGTATPPSGLTRDGYTFDSWNMSADGTGATAILTGITADMTVYAKWIENVEPVETFIVTFKGNGGTWGDGATEKDVTVAVGHVAVPPSGLTRDGYTLYHTWYMNADGTGEADLTNILSDMVVYAKWNKDVEPTPTPRPDPPETTPANLDAMDIPRMLQIWRDNGSKGEFWDIYLAETGEWGYGGAAEFFPRDTSVNVKIPVYNHGEGWFYLTQPYTVWSSLEITFCDDGGSHRTTVTWTKSELDAALNGSAPFNLTKDNVASSTQLIWEINPFSLGSTSDLFTCYYQNCGIVGIHGIV